MARDTRLSLALLALAVAVFLMALMPATQLWDWDEPLYARTAVEMLQSGNFVLPTFNGAVFPDKTPLTYWLMAASISVLGQTEFAVRLPSGLAMALAVWLTGLIGARLFTPRVGLRAAAILGTSLLAVYIGAAAMVDAGLLAAITLGFWALAAIVQGAEPAGRPVLIFGAAMALSLYAKGPVGPAVLSSGVVLAFALTPAAARPPMRRFWALVGISVAGLGLFLLWAVPAAVQSHGEMVTKGIGLHIIRRALAPMEGHGGAGLAGWLAQLPYYVPVVILGLGPWVLYLPGALAALARGQIGGRPARALVWAWILPGFVLFSLAATKLPHYTLPVFPALALAIAASVERLARPWLGLVLLICGGLVMAAGIFALAAYLPVFAGPLPRALVALAFALPALLGLGATLRGQAQALVVPFALLAPLALAGAYWLILPAAEPGIKLSRQLGQVVAAHRAAGQRVYMAGYDEPSLVFYAHLPAGEAIERLPADDAGLQAAMADAAPMLLVATALEKARAEALAGGRPFTTLAEAMAVNTNAGGRMQQVFVLQRPGG